jgi:hypothetical protein
MMAGNPLTELYAYDLVQKRQAHVSWSDIVVLNRVQFISVPGRYRNVQLSSWKV